MGKRSFHQNWSFSPIHRGAKTNERKEELFDLLSASGPGKK